MNLRAMYAGIGVLIFAAIAAAMLATPVYGDRGRDEAFYLTIHELHMQPGAMVTQQVPLQRPNATAIEIPYRWLAAQPATVDVHLKSIDGSTLSDRQEYFPNSRGSRLLQPTGNGTVWQAEQATFKTISLPGGLSGQLVLTLTRIDQSSQTLTLFASTALGPPSTTDLGTQPGKRPAIAERPGEVLDLETEYGSIQPAASKLPTYVSRIASIGPPWLPEPLFVLLFVGAVLITLLLFVVVAMAPDQAAQISLNDE